MAIPNGPPILTNGSPREENQEISELVEALLEVYLLSPLHSLFGHFHVIHKINFTIEVGYACYAPR